MKKTGSLVLAFALAVANVPALAKDKDKEFPQSCAAEITGPVAMERISGREFTVRNFERSNENTVSFDIDLDLSDFFTKMANIADILLSGSITGYLEGYETGIGPSCPLVMVNTKCFDANKNKKDKTVTITGQMPARLIDKIIEQKCVTGPVRFP